ncbi:MAG: Elongation factor 1-alpha [Candidatus Syntrophoarchaeum sp. GoM_oil]|nr:MAG: Elongation factor 1-alpha [Candidatus Syntrophoarchaeum sp. GoM_oil]
MTKIAIIGSEKSGRTTLASKLGKKGNVSDITMYDFARSGTTLVSIDAKGYPKSIKPLITALNLADIALLCIPPGGLDAYAGECIVALDLLGYKHGIIVLTKSDTSYPQALDELKNNIKKITAGTALEDWEYIAVSTTTFEGMEELKEMISMIGEKVDAENAELNDLPPRVVIDHVFNVKGIGCVVLGMVLQGTINTKDKMIALPINRPVEIRSIQMHDVDVKSASTGSRVGLALKNIQPKDVERGCVISNEEIVAADFTLNCTLSKFTKEISIGDMLHLFTGLQSAPARLEKIIIDGEDVDHATPGSRCLLTLSGSKNIAYSRSDRFILANLDEKQRFVGYGVCNSPSKDQ